MEVVILFRGWKWDRTPIIGLRVESCGRFFTIWAGLRFMLDRKEKLAALRFRNWKASLSSRLEIYFDYWATPHTSTRQYNQFSSTCLIHTALGLVPRKTVIDNTPTQENATVGASHSESIFLLIPFSIRFSMFNFDVKHHVDLNRTLPTHSREQTLNATTSPLWKKQTFLVAADSINELYTTSFFAISFIEASIPKELKNKQYKTKRLECNPILLRARISTKP